MGSFASEASPSPHLVAFNSKDEDEDEDEDDGDDDNASDDNDDGDISSTDKMST